MTSTLSFAMVAGEIFLVDIVPSSSMAEHPPVKRMVAGSSPASAALTRDSLIGRAEAVDE